MPLENPHIAIPFRFSDDGTSVICVEQESMDEVKCCVEAIIRTPRGLRDELPTFGISDPTFAEGDVNTDRLLSEVSDHEDRAELFATEEPDEFDQLVRVVQLTVTQRGNSA